MRKTIMAAKVETYNVDVLGKPLGQYSHVTRVKASELLFIAGMLSSDKHGQIVGVGDFDAQCVQVFANVEAALESAGASDDTEGDSAARRRGDRVRRFCRTALVRLWHWTGKNGHWSKLGSSLREFGPTYLARSVLSLPLLFDLGRLRMHSARTEV
jgi:hypothetical protein